MSTRGTGPRSPFQHYSPPLGGDWRDQALCAQVDAELWFPVLGADTTKAAKALCNGSGDRPPCPVREQCLAWALEADERFGVLGGLSPKERKKLRRQQYGDTGRKPAAMVVRGGVAR